MIETEDEIFRLLGGAWNITALRKYIEENPDKITKGTVNPMIFNKLIGFIGINQDLALVSKRTDPIIIITMKDESSMLVDGWHRVYRDIHLEKPSIEVYVVPYEIQQKFRL